MAGGMSRREALRAVGGGLFGAVLASLGLKAWGAPPPNSQCGNYCRDTCGVSPGGGDAFRTCVSSCRTCLSTAGTVCACPAGGSSTSVVCCHSPDVCARGTCVTPCCDTVGYTCGGGYTRCNPNPSGVLCLCFQSTAGVSQCGGNRGCTFNRPCTTSEDCPAGEFCSTNSCCTGNVCRPSCAVTECVSFP